MTSYSNPEALKDPGNFAGRRSHVLDQGVENMAAAMRRHSESEARVLKHPLLDVDSYIAPGSRNTQPVYSPETADSHETPDELVQNAILENIEAIHEANRTKEMSP